MRGSKKFCVKIDVNQSQVKQDRSDRSQGVIDRRGSFLPDQNLRKWGQIYIEQFLTVLRFTRSLRGCPPKNCICEKLAKSRWPKRFASEKILTAVQT
jgi:hypothetical protein